MSLPTASGNDSTNSIGEFQLIERFFKRTPSTSSHVTLGVGDDCALLAAAPGEQWAVSTDTLIERIHFPSGTDAAALGHKALAVNLSDLAACGATPRCFFLALALPGVDQVWLERFSQGLFALADEHACMLAGGDTTRSHDGVMITITALGTVPAGRALLRSGARVDDDIWVSGELGDAALALAFVQGEVGLPPPEAQSVVARLERSTPRVALGERLREIASSAIDISDGLLGDLRHILQASAVGAVIEWPQIPRSRALQSQPLDRQQRCALAGGDDYELAFTAASSRRADVVAAAAGLVSVTRIGMVTSAAGLTVLDERGAPVDTAVHAYDHFRP